MLRGLKTMIQLIYDFIRNVLIGETTMQGADDLATLLTYTTLVCMFIILIKLVVWAFNLGSGKRKTRI